MIKDVFDDVEDAIQNGKAVTSDHVKRMLANHKHLKKLYDGVNCELGRVHAENLHLKQQLEQCNKKARFAG